MTFMFPELLVIIRLPIDFPPIFQRGRVQPPTSNLVMDVDWTWIGRGLDWIGLDDGLDDGLN